MIKLGVARKYAKDLINYITMLSIEKIDAYEMGFAFGVPHPFPQEFKNTAESKGVYLNGHLPFWINFGNLEKREKNIQYLLEGFRIAENLKCTVVFHLGFYGKNSYADIRNNIISCFSYALENCKLINGRIGIETTGKQKAIGTIDEIIEIVNILNNRNIVPIIDWSHIYARSNGKIGNSKKSFFDILQRFECDCKVPINYFHGGSVLFENGNEKKHISAKNLSPSMPILLDVLEKKGIMDYTLIIESPDSINDIHWLRS